MDSAEKIARNNSLFRDANNEIEGVADEHAFDRDRLVPFICECSDGRCVEIIRLTLEEYEHVRGDPRWFAHAVGHEEHVEGAVITLERHERHVLVEKIGEAGEVAARLADGQSEKEGRYGRTAAPEG